MQKDNLTDQKDDAYSHSHSHSHSLYQELIIDHSRHPRNFKRMDDATVIKEGFNPLCGDQLILFLKIADGKIMDISFEGKGCAISLSSASLMTEGVKGKSLDDAKSLFTGFHEMVMGQEANLSLLGKLSVLKGVCEFPSRVKCASLAWHTMMAMIEDKDGKVSTE